MEGQIPKTIQALKSAKRKNSSLKMIFKKSITII